MRELALFAGAGGGILGGHLLGWRTVCAVEIEEYPRRILLARQRDGILPRFPIWDDVTTFDGYEWRGRVDVVSGGFPCQDISAAGKGAGIDGARSGLWAEFARIVGEIQPAYVFVENSPMLTSRGLGRVLGDLSQLGYDAEWGVVSAADCGAWHERKRIWILASNNSKKRIQGVRQKKIFNFALFPWGEDVRGIEDLRRRSAIPEPLICGGCHGVANQLDRLAAIGNGQVPIVASTAFRILEERLNT